MFNILVYCVFAIAYSYTRLTVLLVTTVLAYLSAIQPRGVSLVHILIALAL